MHDGTQILQSKRTLHPDMSSESAWSRSNVVETIDAFLAPPKITITTAQQGKALNMLASEVGTKWV